MIRRGVRFRNGKNFASGYKIFNLLNPWQSSLELHLIVYAAVFNTILFWYHTLIWAFWLTFNPVIRQALKRPGFKFFWWHALCWTIWWGKNRYPSFDCHADGMGCNLTDSTQGRYTICSDPSFL